MFFFGLGIIEHAKYNVQSMCHGCFILIDHGQCSNSIYIIPQSMVALQPHELWSYTLLHLITLELLDPKKHAPGGDVRYV